MKKRHLVYSELFLFILFVCATIIEKELNNEVAIVANNLEAVTQSENTYTTYELQCKGNKNTRCVIGCTCGVYYTTPSVEGGDIESANFHCYGCGDIVGW